MKKPKPHKQPKGQQQPAHPAAAKAKTPAHKSPQHHKQHVSKATQHARHVAAVRAARTRAAKPKIMKPTKVRGLSLGDVQCCAADALAWSLRLSGWPVGDADVLALYRLTADSPEAGASILATLDAAYLFGLAGIRPAGFEAVTDLDDPRPLLLGVDLPGQHTVLSAGGWITWGQWYPPGAFPDAVIEEAWAVTWP